jgi:hypothetical protein
MVCVCFGMFGIMRHEIMLIWFGIGRRLDTEGAMDCTVHEGLRVWHHGRRITPLPAHTII